MSIGFIIIIIIYLFICNFGCSIAKRVKHFHEVLNPNPLWPSKFVFRILSEACLFKRQDRSG